jgi:orotidine-5'-phosphate decarboxylase
VIGERFSDRLVEAVRSLGAPTCVGLDPVLEKLPTSMRSGDPIAGIEEFCRGVLGAVAGVCPIVKLQSACFERYGGAGVGCLERLIAEARGLGLLVLLDAKRGDIGISAEHYAHAGLGTDEAPRADAMTVSGYLGADAVEPFIRPGRGVFVLVRTSNPGSDGVQSVKLADGRTVAEMMADQVAALGSARLGRHGYSDVGAVVGATKAEDGRALRARMPKQIFLAPGYGAQGGTADDIRALVDGRPECGGGVLVTASRSVIYAFDPGDRAWTKAVARAALKFGDEIRAVVG